MFVPLLVPFMAGAAAAAADSLFGDGMLRTSAQEVVAAAAQRGRGALSSVRQTIADAVNEGYQTENGGMLPPPGDDDGSSTRPVMVTPTQEVTVNGGIAPRPPLPIVANGPPPDVFGAEDIDSALWSCGVPTGTVAIVK